MNGKRIAMTLLLVGALFLLIVGSLWSAEKGGLYLMSERQTLTQRAGIPCTEEEGNYCNRNFRCKEGHVVRGILMNMNEKKGKSIPTGFGVICTDPNELYKNYEAGAFGENFSGKVFREPCDIGFYLAGARFYTNDQKTITGTRAVCRRYWPVEEREGMNAFGGGMENMPIVCEPGKFVTGVKLGYWRDKEEGKTGLLSIRFYCAEMREYKGTPKKEKDPREK